MQTIQEIITQICQISKIKEQLQSQLQKTLSRSQMQDQIQTTTSKLTRLYFNYKSQKESPRSCKRNYNRSCSQFQSNKQKIFRKKWSKEQQKLFCHLIGRYGSDFSFLQTYFKNKTRKQLKKKYQQIHKNKKCLDAIERIEEQIIRQRKKSLFQQQMLQQSSSSLNCDKNDLKQSQM